jgi:hypothetical protein
MLSIVLCSFAGVVIAAVGAFNILHPQPNQGAMGSIDP